MGGAQVVGGSRVVGGSGIVGSSGIVEGAGVTVDSSALTDSRVHLPALALLRTRLSPKAPLLAVPNKRPKKDSAILRGVSVDLSLSPLIPHIQIREGLSYAAGLRVSIPVWKKLAIIPGFQYTRVGIQQYKDSGNSPVHSASRITKCDLSVLIGYRAEFKQFRLGVNTGLIANLHSRPVGAFAYSNRYWYVKNTGLSLYMGLDLEKKLGPNWSLFVEPYYRQQLTKRLVVPNSQLTDASGCFFGMRYNFKKGRQRR